MDQVGHKDRIALEVVEPDSPYQRKIGSNMKRTINRNGRFRLGKNNDGTSEEFKSYIASPSAYMRQFDVIINDGRARVAVANGVLREQLLLDGGIMMMHDRERREYKAVLGVGRFKVWKEDDSEERQTAFLIPYDAA